MAAYLVGGKLVFQGFGALAKLEGGLLPEWTQAELTAVRTRGRLGATRRSKDLDKQTLASDTGSTSAEMKVGGTMSS